MVTARELTAAPIAIGPLDWSTARIRSPVLDGWSEPPPSGVLVVAGVPVESAPDCGRLSLSDRLGALWGSAFVTGTQEG